MRKGLLKKIALMTMGLVLLGSLTACSSEKEKKNESKNSKEIVVGFDNTFVPMGFVDEKNEIVGFDIDLAKEAFGRMGMTPRFENIDWSMKEQSLKNKNVDVLWNGYSITEERKKQVEFTDPYLDNKQIIISMSKESFNKKEDLKGQVVATQAASSGLSAIEADKAFTDIIKDKKATTYDTYDKALRDLEIGRVKAVVGDEVLLKYYIKQRGADKYKVLEGDLGSEQYGIGFRKDDKELRDKLNKTLDEMKKDGTFKKIQDKWFK